MLACVSALPFCSVSVSSRAKFPSIHNDTPSSTTYYKAGTGGGAQFLGPTAVEFPTATANYGTVTHVGVYDASSSGNLMAYAALSSNKTIETGDVFRVPSGDLDITLN